MLIVPYGDRSNVKSVQFVSRIIQCGINCIFYKKINSVKSHKYQNFLHDSYQINHKIYKGTNIYQKYWVIKCILAENPEIRVVRFPENALTAYLENRLYINTVWTHWLNFDSLPTIEYVLFRWYVFPYKKKMKFFSASHESFVKFSKPEWGKPHTNKQTPYMSDNYRAFN